MNIRTKLKFGFSLFEMAIALTILSILMASVFTLVPVKQEQQNIDEINAKLTRIQQALDSFYNQNGYLPCPAPLNANFSDVGTQIGIAQDCTAAVPSGITEYDAPEGYVWIGAIPTRTLNLPDDFMFDPWNHRIEYGVVKGLAQSKTNYSSFTSAGAYFIIQDSLLNQINTDSYDSSNPKAVNIAAYTLFSHGKDGNGSTNTSGTSQSCSSSALDNENCNNDHIFIDATFNSTSGSSYYDDYIRWKTNQQQARDGTLGGGSGNGVGSTAGNSYSLIGVFVEQYSNGSSDGGTCTAASWNTRNINTIIVNNLSSASLSSNNIILGAGNYFIRASGPGFAVGYNLIRIFNVTSGSVITYGDAQFSYVATPVTQAPSTASIAVTFTVPTTIRIDHYCTTTRATSGLGTHGTIPNGIPYSFTQVEIWQKL
jgi:prepilin-type N-terminal cleavage/methylation domain-containing protein